MSKNKKRANGDHNEVKAAKKFVIPRKSAKKPLVVDKPLDSRESVEVIKIVHDSFLNPAFPMRITKIQLINNEELGAEYIEKRKAMKEEGRIGSELVEIFGFRYLTKKSISDCSKTGLVANQQRKTFYTIGDPKCGVYLSRSADLMSKRPLPTGIDDTFLVFKVLKGRIKVVAQQFESLDNLMEPTPNYDGHFAKEFPTLSQSSLLTNQIVDSAQMYLYEFELDNIDTHSYNSIYSRRPRQCLPHAIVTFRYAPKSAISNVTYGHKRKLSVTNGSSSQQRKKPFPGNKAGAPPKTSSQSHPEHILWNGSLYNGTRFLANVNIVSSYKSSFVLPIIGSVLAVNSVVKLSTLQRILPVHIFKQGSSSYHISKVTLNGNVYLSCGIKASDKQCPVVDMLASYLHRKKKAIKIDFNSEAFACMLPDCELAQKLGLVFNGSSFKLFCLFVDSVKEGKSTKQPSRAFYQIQQRMVEKRIASIESIKALITKGVPAECLVSELEKTNPSGGIPFSPEELQQIPKELAIACKTMVAQLRPEANRPSSQSMNTNHSIPNSTRSFTASSNTSHSSYDRSSIDRNISGIKAHASSRQLQVPMSIDNATDSKTVQTPNDPLPPPHSNHLDPRLHPHSTQLQQQDAATPTKSLYKHLHSPATPQSPYSSPTNSISKNANASSFHNFDYQNDSSLPMWFENVIQDVHKEGIDKTPQFTTFSEKSSAIPQEKFSSFTVLNKETITTANPSNWLDWYKAALPSNMQKPNAMNSEDESEIPVVTMYQTEDTPALQQTLPLSTNVNLSAQNDIIISLVSGAKITSRRPSDPRLQYSSALKRAIKMNEHSASDETPKLLPLSNNPNMVTGRSNSEDMELSSLTSDDESHQIIVNNFVPKSSSSEVVETPPLPEDTPNTTNGRPPLPPDEFPNRRKASEEIQHRASSILTTEKNSLKAVNNHEPTVVNTAPIVELSSVLSDQLNSKSNDTCGTPDIDLSSGSSKGAVIGIPVLYENSEQLLLTKSAVASPVFVPPTTTTATTTTTTASNNISNTPTNKANVNSQMSSSLVEGVSLSSTNHKTKISSSTVIYSQEKSFDYTSANTDIKRDTTVVKQSFIEPISSPESSSAHQSQGLENYTEIRKTRNDVFIYAPDNAGNEGEKEKKEVLLKSSLSGSANHVDVTPSGHRHISVKASVGKFVEALSVTVIAKKSEAADDISTGDGVSSPPRVVISAAVCKKNTTGNSLPIIQRSPVSPPPPGLASLRRSPRHVPGQWDTTNDLRNSISPRPTKKISDLREILNKKEKERHLSKKSNNGNISSDSIDLNTSSSLSPNLDCVANKIYIDSIVSSKENEEQTAFDFESDELVCHSEINRLHQPIDDLRDSLMPKSDDDSDLRGHLNSIAASNSKQTQESFVSETASLPTETADSEQFDSNTILSDTLQHFHPSLSNIDNQEKEPVNNENSRSQNFEAISDDELERQCTTDGRESPPVVHLYDVASTPDKPAALPDVNTTADRENVECSDDSQGASSSSSAADTMVEQSDDSTSALDPHRMVMLAKAQQRCYQGDMELSPSLADQPSMSPFDEILSCEQQRSTIETIATEEDNKHEVTQPDVDVNNTTLDNDKQANTNQEENIDALDNALVPTLTKLLSDKEESFLEADNTEPLISHDDEELQEKILQGVDAAENSLELLPVTDEQSSKVISVSALSVYLLEFKRQWLESHPDQEDICNNLVDFFKESILK